LARLRSQAFNIARANGVVNIARGALDPAVTLLYLSIASRREAGEVKDASQPGPPLGH
jgi:hypothetical protein